MFILILSGISCSKTNYRVKILQSEVAKIAKMPKEMIEIPDQPRPVPITPATCPLILFEYMVIYDVMKIKSDILTQKHEQFLKRYENVSK